MSRWIVQCLLIFGLLCFSVLAKVVVNDITETEPAVLGSNSTALVCDYDCGNETGVEVKWFFNNDIQIYSWIPMINSPKAMGNYSNILEVDNTTLRFKNITRKMTGTYSCKVSGPDTEDIKYKKMVVYQPPRSSHFFWEDKSETLICALNALFPLPLITISGHYAFSNQPVQVGKPKTHKTETNDDLFDISTTLRLNSSEILETIEFACNVQIPGTSYNETIIYTFNVTSNDTIASSENSTIFFRSNETELLTERVFNSTAIKPNSPSGLARSVEISTALLAAVVALTMYGRS